MKFHFLMVTGFLMACATNDVEVAPQVIRSTLESRINATDAVKIEVTYPVDADGQYLKSKMPALIFIPGGFVEPAEYRWQANELAKRGVVVAVVQQVANLAFFSINNGEAARQLLIKPPFDSFVNVNNISIAGHSLGGVVAIKLALKYPYSKLIVQASYPDSADVKALQEFQLPTLFMAGELDCQASLERVKREYESFQSAITLATFSGATHYQFTNSDAPDIKKNCLPAQELATSHAHMAQVMVDFINGKTLNSTDGVLVESR